MCSVTAAEEGPRGQDVKWRTPTARVRKTGDLQSARARQAEGEEGGWLKTRNREKRPLLHQKVGSVNVSPEQELIRDWTWCKRWVLRTRHVGLLILDLASSLSQLWGFALLVAQLALRRS